jgi:nucleoside-diphosphate-sugar epimerase
MQSKPKTLILGGAGFIGSNLAEHFYKMGSEVTVIDGLLENTGGQKKNLDNLNGKIRIYFKKIEEIQNLQGLIVESDLIVDCMAWTSHHAAIENPFYDLELNCKSHLHLIKNIKGTRNKNIIFLSSRGIYGNVEEKLINEKTPPNPVDIQGVHKLTTEGYFNIYSKIYDFNVVVLRISNCFGKNQPITGDDIGLVGSFIRDALFDKTIEIYGNARKRSLIYINDLVTIVWLIAQKQWSYFVPLNISGLNIPISELAEKIIKIADSGEISLKETPTMIKNIDIGNAIIDESILTELIGKVHLKNIDEALNETINYFKENLN